MFHLLRSSYLPHAIKMDKQGKSAGSPIRVHCDMRPGPQITVTRTPGSPGKTGARLLVPSGLSYCSITHRKHLFVFSKILET